MCCALTVAREYESGGDRIAALAAKRLGWEILDGALIEKIANAAHVDPHLARELDERVDWWLHRISRSTRVASARQHIRSAADAPGWIRAIDAERSRYVQMNSGQNWRDPHLYDLRLNSSSVMNWWPR